MLEQIFIKLSFDQIYIESLNLVLVYSDMFWMGYNVCRGVGLDPLHLEMKGITIFILVVKINISINGLDSLN
jgi:hypothetical protein